MLENKQDVTIYVHQAYFQLTTSITETQIKCKLHWSIILCLPLGWKMQFKRFPQKNRWKRRQKAILREKYELNFYNIFCFCLSQISTSLMNNDRLSHFHNCFMAGVNVTLSQIREVYWIVKGRQWIKSIIGKWLICKWYNAHPRVQDISLLFQGRI